MLPEGVRFVWGESGGEAMEDGIVDVEDAGCIGELGCIPVVVSRENRGFGVRINSKDEGPGRLIGGNCRNLRWKTTEEEEGDEKQKRWERIRSHERERESESELSDGLRTETGGS